MLIHSLTLENCKSYAQATIEFSPGANAIIGSNGAGKTTILEAVGFALFDHRPGPLSTFVREGQELASVTVEFLSDYDERAYQVVRRCSSRGSRNEYRILDPEIAMKICEGRADVSQFLRQHLGIDPETDPRELFRNAVGVPQGSFTASFLATPSARKAVFDSLLKVAEYRRAHERLREPLNLLTQRQNERWVEINRLQVELRQLPSAKSEASELADRIHSAETDLRAAQAELSAAEAARQTMEEKRERMLALQRMTQMQQQKVAEQERTLAAAGRRLAESEKAAATAEAHRAGHEAYRAAQQAQRAVNTRMAQRQQLQDERSAVQIQLTQAETQEQAYTRALAEITEAEKTAAGLADAATEQEKLNADMRDAQRQADRLDDASVRAQGEQSAVDTAQERLDRLRAEVAQARKLEASLEPLQARMETLQQTMTTQQARKAQLQSEKETTQEQGQRLKASQTSAICPICEQPLSAERRQQLLSRLRERWQELTEASQAVAETFRQVEAEREQTRSTLSQREQSLRALPREDAVETAEAELAALRTRLNEARAETEALAQAPQYMEQLQQALTSLGDPQRRRDAALQQAQGRQQVEEALRQQRAQAACQRTALAALDERMAAFADVKVEAARIASQLEKLQTADDLFQRNQAAAEALPQRREEVAEANNALQAAQECYESGQAQLEVSTRDFDEERFQDAVTQADEIRIRSGKLETNLENWHERLGRVKKEIDRLQAQAQRLTAAQSRYDWLTEQKDLLNFMRSVLQEAGPYVNRALVQKISSAANQLFGQIMEDYTRTLHWQEDYGIILEVDGRERAFPQLSGGEQMSAALAVRLALLQELSNIAVAFFDEPTTNLDDARRGALARQIVGVRGFQQLFIISHDDSFEQATEKLIRVEKKNGASEILYE